MHTLNDTHSGVARKLHWGRREVWTALRSRRRRHQGEAIGNGLIPSRLGTSGAKNVIILNVCDRFAHDIERQRNGVGGLGSVVSSSIGVPGLRPTENGFVAFSA